jgi:hypothetical protein
MSDVDAMNIEGRRILDLGSVPVPNGGGVQAFIPESHLEAALVEVWDADDRLFCLPKDATLREVRLALDVYRQGRSDGIAVGRARAQADIRKALGL